MKYSNFAQIFVFSDYEDNGHEYKELNNDIIKQEMKAFVFPGQGAQFVGMGKDLYENNPLAKELFDKANEIL